MHNVCIIKRRTLLMAVYNTTLSDSELCYEREIDIECLLCNDLPTQCRCYTRAQLSTDFSGSDRANNLSVIHSNARSIKENLDKIKDTRRDLNYHGHTSVFIHCSKILKLQDLITHKTMIMLYKANNHCLEGRVEAVHKHDTRQCQLFYVKKRTPPIDYCQLLS